MDDLFEPTIPGAAHWLTGEREQAKQLIAFAKRWGYGRAIQILQGAWSQDSQDSGLSRETSDRAAGIICVWCNTDRRTGKPSGEAKPEGQGEGQ